MLSRCLQFNLKPLPRAADRASSSRRSSRRRRSRSTPAALPLLARGGAGSAARRAVAARPGDRLRRRRSRGSRRCARCSAPSTAATCTGSSMRCSRATARRCSPRPTRWRASGQAFGAALDELATIFYRIAVVQAVPRRAGRRRSGAHRRLRGAIHAGSGAARLSDMRAGSRRPGACPRRGDRLCDDAAAPAGVRAGRRPRGRGTWRIRAFGRRQTIGRRAAPRSASPHRDQSPWNRRRSARRPPARGDADVTLVAPRPVPVRSTHRLSPNRLAPPLDPCSRYPIRRPRGRRSSRACG